MLRRLMVLYFLQSKGLLDYDKSYLSNRLRLLQNQQGKDRFYQHYLIPLFHNFLCNSTQQSAPATLWGNIPALALPLFQIHPLECNIPPIQIPDAAFTRLFAFFDRYQWKLEGQAQQNTPDALYPEVLGDVFAQQINSKQMGVYYTKEDVATYIATNTILPYLLQRIAAHYPEEFAPTSAFWQPLQDRPERYIPSALQSEHYLPKETQREYAERRTRYHHLYTQLKVGKIHTIDDLITCNIAITRLVHDNIVQWKNPELLHALYKELQQMSILDPTCGSGAFLCAALYVLIPLYTTCLQRMQTIASSAPILNTILNNNLYGVDIMEEATDLCKLRLFLALTACNERIEDVQPFSSIYWNIVTGNALTGSVHYSNTVGTTFRASGDCITHATTGHQDQENMRFHWLKIFPAIMQRGGFDIIIGNPPYVEYSKVRQHYKIQEYTTENCGNLYAAVLERSLTLCRPDVSYLGLIVPLSICSSERFVQLRHTMTNQLAKLWLANFEIFPSRLFDGAFQRLSIVIAQHDSSSAECTTRTTRIQRWYAAERPHLIALMRYTHAHQTVKAHVFPKLASPLQETILHKLVEKAQGHSIANVLYSHKTEHFVYYQEATNYWMKATCRVPYYKKNGMVMKPTHGRFLYFNEESTARGIMALMNSSLFYLWFATFSDGFHLSHGLVKDFPLGAVFYEQEELEMLALRLEEDISKHAKMSTRNTKAHLIVLEEYRMSMSKALLDAIDRALARYYGLSDEELAFVLRYDEKYRMGKEK